MKGEYVGQDGRTYRWVIDNGEYTHSAYYDGWSTISSADWPAAKAALDELIESEREGWVEWEVQGTLYRARPTGGDVQFWYRDRWTKAVEGVEEAYRKGLEVGRCMPALSPETPNAPESHWDRICAAVKRVKL